MPGSGSVAGGRWIGYTQGALAIVGLMISLLFGLRFILWSIRNFARFYDPETDPFAALHDMWLAVRWPLLGLGLFAFAWLWALVTSLSLLRQTKADVQAGQKPVPPRLADLTGKPPKPS